MSLACGNRGMGAQCGPLVSFFRDVGHPPLDMSFSGLLMLVTNSYEERREEERVGGGRGEEGKEGRGGGRETMFELNKAGHGFDLSRDHQPVTSILENENLCETSGYLVFFGGDMFSLLWYFNVCMQSLKLDSKILNLCGHLIFLIGSDVTSAGKQMLPVVLKCLLLFSLYY